MPYPGQFHHLVMIGTLYGDQFNMTLNIVPSALGELGMPAVDGATLAAVAGDVGDWFQRAHTDTGPGFIQQAKLVSLKLNRLGTDGHYVDNEAQEHIYPTPVSGAYNANIAPQLSTVITLGTALERGRGSRGRIFLVPNFHQGTLGSDGRVSQAVATAAATGVRYLITALNTRYSLIGRVGVASNAGAGRFEHVTRLKAGRVIDTMRSRRSSLIEDYQEISVP